MIGGAAPAVLQAGNGKHEQNEVWKAFSVQLECVS